MQHNCFTFWLPSVSGGHSFTIALPSFSFVHRLLGQQSDNAAVWAPCPASLKLVMRTKYNSGHLCVSNCCKHFRYKQNVLQAPLPFFSLLIAPQKFVVTQVPRPGSQTVGPYLHLHWGPVTAESEAVKLMVNYPFDDLMPWCVNCLSYHSPRICKLVVFFLVCFWQEKTGSIV